MILEAFGTYESCLRAKRIFNLSQLTIVTQNYHLVRAVATCRALGIDAMGVGDNSAPQHTMAWVARGDSGSTRVPKDCC